VSAGDPGREAEGLVISPSTKTPYAGEPKGAYRPKEFQARYSIGHTKLYQEINAGRLIARKLGSSTVILHDDAEAWAHALPAVELTEAMR
jgi:hypothetical protein